MKKALLLFCTIIIILFSTVLVVHADYTTTVGSNWLITGATIESTAGAFTTLSSTGITAIGDGTATVAIDSSDWAISATGDMTGIGAITADGDGTIAGDLSQSASIFYAVKTKKITIGHVGSTGEDFQFTTVADTTEQVIDAGAIVPAFARVLEVAIINTEAAVFSGGATTLVAELGSTSSGNQYAASATIYAADAVVATANAGWPIAGYSSSAAHVYVSATPGANWSTMTAGQWTLLITYLDLGAIK